MCWCCILHSPYLKLAVDVVKDALKLNFTLLIQWDIMLKNYVLYVRSFTSTGTVHCLFYRASRSAHHLISYNTPLVFAHTYTMLARILCFSITAQLTMGLCLTWYTLHAYTVLYIWNFCHGVSNFICHHTLLIYFSITECWSPNPHMKKNPVPTLTFHMGNVDISNLLCTNCNKD